MPIINLSPIIALSENDAEFREELLANYLANFRSFADELAPPVLEGNLDKVKFIIHKVKASVRMIQGDGLDRLLEELEYGIKSGKVSGAVAENYLIQVKLMTGQIVEEILKQSRDL